MARRAKIERFGGPSAIKIIEETLLAPRQGEVRMRNRAIGLNFIDTYHRSGLYPIPLPSGLGLEAAGEIVALGKGTDGWQIGDRVCTFGPELGAYSDERNVLAANLFRTPDAISDEMAASVLLKGCTAEFLIERCAQVQPGQTVLVHAAAGGVGLLLVSWLKHIGAIVIGSVGTTDKLGLAQQAGADHVIVTNAEDLAERVEEITRGAGVRATFDGVGKDTWETSLRCTGRRGIIASFGNASGPVTGVELGRLASAGSLFCSRPTLFDYYREPAERAAGAKRMFDLVEQGVLTAHVGQHYALEDVVYAHQDLEARKTVGSSVLIP